MVYCVEILAIYEGFGAVVGNPRRNQRDNDFTLAQTQAGQVGHTIPPQAEERMETFEAPSRYGFGWNCRQWISTQADAQTVGNALYTRLAGRSLQPGSKVLVFPADESQPGYVTGDVVYARYWPTPNARDVG